LEQNCGSSRGGMLFTIEVFMRKSAHDTNRVNFRRKWELFRECGGDCLEKLDLERIGKGRYWLIRLG